MKSGGYMAWFSVYKGNIQIAQRQWNLDAKIVTRRDSGRDLSVCPTKTLLAIGISWKPYQYMIFGGAKSHRVIGFFLRTETPISIWFLGGPRGQTPRRKQWISILPKSGELWRPYPATRTPAQTLRSRAHPQDDVSCSAPTPSNYIIIISQHYNIIIL